VEEGGSDEVSDLGQGEIHVSSDKLPYLVLVRSVSYLSDTGVFPELRWQRREVEPPPPSGDNFKDH
jgi:hypothetical protein